MAEEGLTTAMRAWEKLGFAQLQRELDAQGLAVIENQNQAAAARKRLAEETREFKKVPDEEKLKEFKNLLKAYQAEIDSMTKRSKFAETSFLTLYKQLSDMPDPAPLIASALDQTKQLAQVATLQAENRRLRDELATQQAQLAASKSAESSIGSLKQRLSKYEAMLDEMVAEKVAQKEEEMKQVMDEKIRIYKETEHVLSRQVSHFKDQLAMLQTNHEVTQAKLVDETQKYDEGVAARLAELDIVLMDLERSNAKIVQLERETRLLKDQMNAPRDESENEILIKQQHERIREVEAENAEIAQKLDEALSAQRDAEYGAVQRIADLERDVASKSFEIAQMQARLAEFSDYDEIKRELDIIKGIEFDGFVDSEAPAAALDYPIERLLVAKNKKLQSDVMALKAELFEATSMLQECKDARAHAEHLLGESKALVAKLEGDLLRINESWASTATANTPSRRQTMSEGLESLMSDSLAKAAASELPSSVAVGPVGGLASAIGAGSSAEPSAVHEARPLVTSTDASIVPILTSQRDRYKRRFEELEQTTREQNQTLSDLRYEIANLKSDNVKLYEKLRYAETYSAARSQTQARGVSHSIINMGTADRRAAASDADAISSKYRGIYEESLDPFKQFHRQEEQRRFHSMNPAERAALSLTRLLSTNRYSRWIFVIYSAALHLLVFVTLYQLSLADCPTDGKPPKNIWSVHTGDSPAPR